jgi:tetratricopeptide (TPR) repeat protein
MDHPRDIGSSVDEGHATPPTVRVVISGDSYVGKVLVVAHADGVIIGSSHDVSIATQHSPVAVDELLNRIKAELAKLDLTVEAPFPQLWAVASAIEDLIARLRRDAELGAGHVELMLPQVASLVDRLERRLPEAVALRVSLVHLYGAVPDYYMAMAEAERLLQSPLRARFSDDIMLLAILLMNASEYSLALPLFDAVATAEDDSGLLPPAGETERARQRVTADQYRLLWIPHELGRYEETIRHAPGALSAARVLGPRVEAGVLHRLGRAQSDLAVASRDRSLLEASVRSHDAAMSRMEGTYNFFMPMAKYYAERALHGKVTASLLGQTRELSMGLNEGAQAHIHLLDVRSAIDADRYLTAVDLAERCIEMWARHPHPRGVVAALSARALAKFKVGTNTMLVEAAADLELARSIARSRDFDLDRTASSLLAMCQERVDHSEQHKVLDLMSAFRNGHPRLYERPGWGPQAIFTVHQQSKAE